MKEKPTIEINSDAFEHHYHSMRVSEQRIYSNQQIANLPEIDTGHIHSTEWSIRKQSSEKLIQRLKDKNIALDILEVGCGNGWLSAKLAGIDKATVTGIDLNRIELMQAVTTFDKKDNLHFIYGDIRNSGLTPNAYDIIVFASSLQYFSPVAEIITKALSLLLTGGEIHILDTPFYPKDEVPHASERTRAYYASIGFEEMSAYYFHHSLADLRQFNYKIIFNPKNIFFKIKKTNQPFYHIIIKHKL